MTRPNELQNAFRFHIRTMSRNRLGKASYWLKLQRDLDAREGGPAFRALNAARRDVASGTKRYPPAMRGNGSSLGAAFQIGGFRSALGQWCEVPPFRYAGAAHEILKLDHTGYFLDPHGDGETIHGGVYQATARDGRARFIPAMPDPYNSGPAILALGDMVTAADSSEDSAEEAKHNAARRADQLAEYYAEAERDYQTAFAEGREARGKAAEATAAAKAWAGAVRGLYRARHAAGLVGLSPVDVRAEVARAIAAARALRDDLRDARDAAASARRNRPGGLNPDRAARFDGYAEGPL